MDRYGPPLINTVNNSQSIFRKNDDNEIPSQPSHQIASSNEGNSSYKTEEYMRTTSRNLPSQSPATHGSFQPLRPLINPDAIGGLAKPPTTSYNYGSGTNYPTPYMPINAGLDSSYGYDGTLPRISSGASLSTSNPSSSAPSPNLSFHTKHYMSGGSGIYGNNKDSPQSSFPNPPVGASLTSGSSFGACPPPAEPSAAPYLKHQQYQSASNSMMPPPSAATNSAWDNTPRGSSGGLSKLATLSNGSLNSKSNSNIRRNNSRIDPSQMPRPERPSSRDVLYHTRSTSGTGRRNPPSCLSHFKAIDTGNCSPRQMRATMVAPPCTQKVLQQVELPFSILCSPFAEPRNGEEPVATVDLQGELPPRCSRCRAYINNAVRWLEGGNCWQCNLCTMTNSTPSWYFCSTDGANERLDRLQRPELHRGTVDFIVNEDYCVRSPQEPIYIFALDISHKAAATGVTIASLQAVRSAITQLRVKEMEYTLDVDAKIMGGSYSSTNIPKPKQSVSKIKVGIVTFDSTVQFYKVDCGNNRENPVKLLIVGADDPMCPLPPEHWLLSVTHQQEELEALLQRIPEIIAAMHLSSERSEGSYSIDSNTSSAPCCVAAAIKSIQLSLETLGGRLFVITSSHATVGLGSIGNNREKIELYGSKDELQLYGAAEAISEKQYNFSITGSTAAAVRTTPDKNSSSAVSALASFIGVGSTTERANDDNSHSSQSNLRNSNSRSTTAGANSKAASEHKALLEDFRNLNAAYQKLAEDCARSVLCVSICACVGENHLNGGEYLDISLLSEPVMLTGGRLHFVTGSMTRESNVTRLEQQIVSDIDAVHAGGAEAVLKLRTSLGIRVADVLGPGQYNVLRSEVELCGIDPSSSFMFNLQHDTVSSRLKEDEKVFVQLAVLYTSPDCKRQRRVRVLNLMTIASQKHTLVFRNSDIEAVVAAFAKTAIHRALHFPLSEVDKKKSSRSSINEMVTDVLHNYRIHCSPQSPRGQLILPDSLKVLPIYALGILKHPSLSENHTIDGRAVPLSGGNSTPSLLTAGTGRNSGSHSITPTYGSPLSRIAVRAHERAFEMRRLLCAPLEKVIQALYPRLYSILPLLDDLAAAAQHYQQQQQLVVTSDCDSNVDYGYYGTGQNYSHDDFKGDSYQHIAHKILTSSSLNPSAEALESDQIYLLDDGGCILYMYVGRTVSERIINELFITNTRNSFGPGEEVDIQIATERGKRFYALIEMLRADNVDKQDIKVLWAGINSNSSLMQKFSSRLVEDANAGQISYVDFLCNLHTKIQGRL